MLGVLVKKCVAILGEIEREKIIFALFKRQKCDFRLRQGTFLLAKDA